MSLITRLHALNECGEILPLNFLAHTIGLVNIEFAQLLPSSLVIRSQSSLILLPDINGKFPQTEIENWFMRYFEKHNLTGFRQEEFAIFPLLNRTLTPIGKLDRGLLGYLGICGYGVHVNGYVRTAEGISMWIAQRAANKREAPNRWDQIVAGGVTYPLTPFQCMQKECKEEAGLDEAQSGLARLGNELVFLYEQSYCVRPDTIYCYDLRLSTHFQPTCQDGEVQQFALRPLTNILYDIAETKMFKANSAGVIIDFALRHDEISGNDAEALRKQLQRAKRRIQHEIGVIV